jgi:alpha-beta hydrolase superfamily lysophospholipase
MAHFEFERKASDGLSVYFQGWQTEGAQKGVICLVHGLGEHSGRYVQWANWSNQAGYTVISYDLRGHGKSAGLRGHVTSFEEYFKDTDILLQEAKSSYPSLPCFLYGHSLGAIIVCDYVLHRKPQLAGVILSAISIKTALQEQKGKILLARLIGAISPKFTMDSGLDPATISRDPEVVSTYVNDPLVHRKITVGFGISSMAAIDFIHEHANEWTLPVLIMHGEMDKLGYADGSRELASKIKGDCTLKIWPGMVHEIHNEPEKQQVFEFLLQWLDTHLNK